MSYSLRDYQVPGFDAGMSFFSATNPKPSIIVAPTAYGKSVLIGHLAQHIDGNTLIIQPSKELLEQNYRKFTALGGRGSIFSASFNKKNVARATYATIGSICKIGKLFKEWNFQNLIIDEAHLYPRDVISDKNVQDGETGSMLATFLYESGIKKVLGLTATAFKLQSNTGLDGERFSKLQMLTSGSKHGHFFKEIIHVTQIQELVQRGYWSKLVYDIHEFDRSSLEYNSTKADFTQQSLHWSFERANIRTKILEHACGNQRNSTLIFVPSIEEAIKIARQLDSCAAVHSKLKPAERDRIINDFKSGKLRRVVNVNVLSVGFDHPEVDHIISGRPTASLAWFYQALGRGTRIAEGKPNCLITDFVGNVERFGKIEELVYKKKKAWQLYGEGGKLLTGIGLHNIGTVTDEPDANVVFPFGKHKDKTVGYVMQNDPGYINWLMNGKDFKFTSYSMHIKEAIDRLSKKEQVTH